MNKTISTIITAMVLANFGLAGGSSIENLVQVTIDVNGKTISFNEESLGISKDEACTLGARERGIDSLLESKKKGKIEKIVCTKENLYSAPCRNVKELNLNHVTFYCSSENQVVKQTSVFTWVNPDMKNKNNKERLSRGQKLTTYNLEIEQTTKANEDTSVNVKIPEETNSQDDEFLELPELLKSRITIDNGFQEVNSNDLVLQTETFPNETQSSTVAIKKTPILENEDEKTESTVASAESDDDISQPLIGGWENCFTRNDEYIRPLLSKLVSQNKLVFRGFTIENYFYCTKQVLQESQYLYFFSFNLKVCVIGVRELPAGDIELIEHPETMEPSLGNAFPVEDCRKVYAPAPVAAA
jgi:hypothetical protein